MFVFKVPENLYNVINIKYRNKSYFESNLVNYDLSIQ